VGPRVRPEVVRNIALPPGFDSRTVQSVAGRYTDWATRSTRAVTVTFSFLCNVSSNCIELFKF
jgi:hypothetical protein